MALIKCPECGGMIPDKSKFCSECGAQITKPDIHHSDNSDESVDQLLADINELLAKPSNSTKRADAAKNMTNKKRKTLSRRGILLFIVAFCMVCVLVIVYPIFTVKRMQKQADSLTANSISNSDFSEIEKTRNSLAPYLDVLGTQGTDNNFDASTEFISGLSSVYIMGRTGTVTHGFVGTEDYVTINLLEWQDNANSSEEEFKDFIEKLNTYFDSDALYVTSYTHISDEAYIWFDSNYGCCAILWYDGTTIHISWDTTETSLNNIPEYAEKQQSTSADTSYSNASNSTKKCLECGNIAEHSYINPFSGKTEYYCTKHYQDIQGFINQIQGSSSTNIPETNSARHTDIEAWSCAQNIVEGYLKAPSTAKFCKFYEATITHLGNGEYMVTGWVDAENSFGAMLRSTFIVTYTATPKGYKNGSAILS